MAELLSFDEAVGRTVGLARLIGEEEVPILKAYGRVLRQDVSSPVAIPPFDRSMMDGYAIRFMDVTGASPERPVVLRVIEELPAGRTGRRTVAPGTAARIMTGAPLPDGADAVIKQELTERDGDTVRVLEAVGPGNHIGRAGEDVGEGEVVLKSGTTIGAAAAGMIGSCGLARVRVSRRPRVAVLSTGSEVVRPGVRRRPGQIYDSNGYTLVGLARRAGAEARHLGLAKDRPGSLERLLERARGHDVLLVSGGVSVGDYDLVRDQLMEHGFRQVFWRVAMKPGKPSFLGDRGDSVVFGLPGNPVSCMVCFEMLVRPYLDACTGKTAIGLPRLRAVLGAPLRARGSRRKFLRATLSAIEQGLAVLPFAKQQSGVLTSMVQCNALIDVPPDTTSLEAGTVVTTIPLEPGWVAG